MKVYVDQSPAGAGKTERAIHRLVSTVSKTVFVTERKESFAELNGRISQKKQYLGMPSLVIRELHGDQNNLGNSVSKEIENLPAFYANTDHVVVIITHAALLRSDFSNFQDWDMTIDEVPRFLDFEEKRTALDAAYFEANYALCALTEAWSAITATPAGAKLSTADVLSDQSHSHLSVFHSRVLEANRPHSDRKVLCNLTSWEQMKSRKVQWCWASVFSLNELAAFKRVELLGNQFLQDIGGALSRFIHDDIEWDDVTPINPICLSPPRTVNINYFSEYRRASRTLFESNEGQAMLRSIGKHIAVAQGEDDFIWSGNEHSVKPQLLLDQAKYLLPKQAGTNRYRHVSNAAIIYAAKPCANLRSLLIACGIKPEGWTESVESETILQFVTRTSVRNPSDTSTVSLWVFDKWQAEYLYKYFENLPYTEPLLQCAQIDFEIPQQNKLGRPPVHRTPEEQEQFLLMKKKKDAARNQKSRALKKQHARLKN